MLIFDESVVYIVLSGYMQWTSHFVLLCRDRGCPLFFVQSTKLSSFLCILSFLCTEYVYYYRQWRGVFLVGRFVLSQSVIFQSVISLSPTKLAISAVDQIMLGPRTMAVLYWRSR